MSKLTFTLLFISSTILSSCFTYKISSQNQIETTMGKVPVITIENPKLTYKPGIGTGIAAIIPIATGAIIGSQLDEKKTSQGTPKDSVYGTYAGVGVGLLGGYMTFYTAKKIAENKSNASVDLAKWLKKFNRQKEQDYLMTGLIRGGYHLVPKKQLQDVLVNSTIDLEIIQNLTKENNIINRIIDNSRHLIKLDDKLMLEIIERSNYTSKNNTKKDYILNAKTFTDLWKRNEQYKQLSQNDFITLSTNYIKTFTQLEDAMKAVDNLEPQYKAITERLAPDMSFTELLRAAKFKKELINGNSFFKTVLNKISSLNELSQVSEIAASNTENKIDLISKGIEIFHTNSSPQNFTAMDEIVNRIDNEIAKTAIDIYLKQIFERVNYNEEKSMMQFTAKFNGIAKASNYYNDVENKLQVYRVPFNDSYEFWNKADAKSYNEFTVISFNFPEYKPGSEVCNNLKNYISGLKTTEGIIFTKHENVIASIYGMGFKDNVGIVCARWYRAGTSKTGELLDAKWNTGFEPFRGKVIDYLINEGAANIKAEYWGDDYQDKAMFAAREARAKAYKVQSCLNCEIDDNKTVYPHREEKSNLFRGSYTEDVKGKIVMKNGSTYQWKYDDDNYYKIAEWGGSRYKSFSELLTSFLERCKNSYCR